MCADVKNLHNRVWQNAFSNHVGPMGNIKWFSVVGLHTQSLMGDVNRLKSSQNAYIWLFSGVYSHYWHRLICGQKL